MGDVEKTEFQLPDGVPERRRGPESAVEPTRQETDRDVEAGLRPTKSSKPIEFGLDWRQEPRFNTGSRAVVWATRIG
ncbi:MAG: hypothetical protein Q4A92_10820 [Corynebacterium sp.]|nr:hypothetical protein [Corynebacterium sp.]